MAEGWFIHRDGQSVGPFNAAQLKSMTTTGQLLPVDQVRKGDGGRWVPASQVKGLFNGAAVGQPPPLPAPPAAARLPPPPVPVSPLDFVSGPPPAPTPAPGGTSVEVVDRKAIPTNPVAMALLSGLILIPVGHFVMGQVLKGIAVMLAAPWLMVSPGYATGGLGLPVVLLAYAVLMGADAYLLAQKRSAGEPVGPWDTPVVGKLLGARGLLPARIALPVLGMMLVVGSGLCLSLFGVKVALLDNSDLRNQLLLAFSLFHCVFAAVAIVLTARLQHAVAAPVAAVLSMTAWGWYCFATVPPVASILGLMAGISIGAWALWTFRSPDVKAQFADAGKPGPLDRLGMPVFAGSAVGLLVLILGVGGVLYAVARDKSMDKYAQTDSDSSSRGSSRETKERTMKERTMRERSPEGRTTAGSDGSWAEKAFALTGEKKDPSFKPAPAGSRQDFCDAINILAERPAVGPIRSGGKLMCYFPTPGIEATVWEQIFGTPTILPKGRERIGRVENEFDRWQHPCSDGTVTLHGKIGKVDGETHYLPRSLNFD